MDVNAAIARISELENRIRELTEERNNFASAVVNCEEFLRQIPRSLPGGLDPDSMTPNEWLKWAKEQLGYENAD